MTSQTAVGRGPWRITYDEHGLAGIEVWDDPHEDDPSDDDEPYGYLCLARPLPHDVVAGDPT